MSIFVVLLQRSVNLGVRRQLRDCSNSVRLNCILPGLVLLTMLEQQISYRGAHENQSHTATDLCGTVRIRFHQLTFPLTTLKCTKFDHIIGDCISKCRIHNSTESTSICSLCCTVWPSSNSKDLWRPPCGVRTVLQKRSQLYHDGSNICENIL